jgi:hypothetical protein
LTIASLNGTPRTTQSTPDTQSLWPNHIQGHWPSHHPCWVFRSHRGEEMRTQSALCIRLLSHGFHIGCGSFHKSFLGLWFQL